jgi:hypothetical protein
MAGRPLLSFLFIASSSLLSGWARAQGPQLGASTPLPLAVDLKKVPVGSWSEYRIVDGEKTLSVRMALVTRSARTVDVETQIRGGPVAALGRATVRMSLPLGAGSEIKPRDQVIQLGDNPPMLLPDELGRQGAQLFKKLDPKQRVGVDKVTVPAGVFPRADHYREKGSGGEDVDFWIDRDVLPFGLLKVTSSARARSTSVTMELTAHGGGAGRVITQPPKPFDAAAIMKQAEPAMAGTSGPPLRPIPSPHPGMPPTPAGSTHVPPPTKSPPSRRDPQSGKEVGKGADGAEGAPGGTRTKTSEPRRAGDQRDGSPGH